MNNIILERKYYAIEITTLSPLSVSGGGEANTDADLMKNAEGTYFVPGTSLAGAFRNYFQKKKDEKAVFGFAKNNDGAMSSVFISDLYFVKEPVVSVRDRIKVEEQGEDDGNKFDLEIIESGAKGILYLTFLCREKDSWDYDFVIQKTIQGLQNGEIRIGANKNRGFGRLKVERIFEKSFTKENIDEWIAFVSASKDLEQYGSAKSYESWMQGKEEISKKYIKVEVPLKLQGGISIRRYSTEPEKADYVHLLCDGKPVIPGTSWNGAIRKEAARILEQLQMDKKSVDRFIKEWFGYVLGESARQSRVVIGESILTDASPVPMTRNSINRFSAATRTGALYSEISYYGGCTKLEMMVPKTGEYKAFLGVLLIIIKEIQKGYLPIGGQVAIGRGIFEKDENGEVRFSEDISETECLNHLYTYLCEVAK